MNYDSILARANELYAEEKKPIGPGRWRPGFAPEIRSDQVKSILQALVEAINDELLACREENDPEGTLRK